MDRKGAQRNWRRLWLPAILCLLFLLAEVYLFSRNVFETKNKAGGAAPLATLKATQNQVLQKADGTLVWQSPKEGSSLFREDAVATMANSQAVITFADRSELVVEPDSLVILEMAPPMGGGAPPAGSRIVARLIKGSVKRKSAGPSTVMVKLSSDPKAEAAVLDDAHGSAIFRLVHDSAGLRIIIEGGSVTLNGSRDLKESDTVSLALGEKKLPPPRLRKPSVETKFQKPPRKDDESLLDRAWRLLVPEASAAEAGPAEAEQELQVKIHFDWEPVAGAEAYLIQIAKDSDFREVILEKRVPDTEFIYEFRSPNERTEFFFRAAAVSRSAEPGKFSDAQRVDVLPRKIPVLDRPREEKTAAAKPPPVKAKKHAKAMPKAEPPAPVPPADTEAAAPSESNGLHGEAAFGVVFHHRTFKNTTQKPTTAQGSGFVPANLRLEGRARLSEDRSLVFGGSYLAEVAKILDDSGSKSTQKVGTPLWRAWGLLGFRGETTTLAVGPYATSSSAFGFSGLAAVSQNKVLLGALGRVSPNTDATVPLYWSVQAGALASGTTGADLSLSVRQPLRYFGSLHPFQLSSESSFFWGIEAQGRFSKLESNQGGMLEVGRLF